MTFYLFRNLSYTKGPSWPWSYGSWIYDYLCNQCLSPLKLWVLISIRVRCTTSCDKVFVSELWQVGGFLWHKTVHHDITEILLKVVFNTIKQTNKHNNLKLEHKLLTISHFFIITIQVIIKFILDINNYYKYKLTFYVGDSKERVI